VVVIAEGGKSCHGDPVEVGIIDESVDFEEGLGLALLNGELDNEGVSLNNDMTADCLSLRGGSGSVNQDVGDLGVLSLAVVGVQPGPLNIDDTLIEHSDSQVEVREDATLVDESHGS